MMALLQGRPCSTPRCPVVVTKNKACPAHGDKVRRRDADQHRGTAAERGYDARWNRFSGLYRKRNPLCAHCERDGRVTPVDLVDHVIPLKVWPQGKYVGANLQPLCEACHARKGQKESGLQACAHEHERHVEAMGTACEDCGRVAA